MNYFQKKEVIVKVQKYIIFGKIINLKKCQVDMLDLFIIEKF